MNNELLKKICMVNSVTGREDAVRDFILNDIKEYIDDYQVDAMGNLIAHKKADGKKMMLAGHMDQIGMMVTFIDENGFIKFSQLGGLSPACIYTQKVIFENKTVGVVGCERLDEGKQMKLENMYIDICAGSYEEAVKKVKIGDVCTYYSEAYTDDVKIISPALDDRVGCFIMMEALKKLKNPKFDCYFVFTTQEEVGLRGAKTSAYIVEPDYCLAYDVTLSYDTPKCLKYPQKVGAGAAIKVKDSSVICHETMINHLEKCAKKANIKHQFEILDFGGTDTGAIHVNKGGVPSGAISVTTRYVHSSCEMASLADIDDCISLTVEALETEI